MKTVLILALCCLIAAATASAGFEWEVDELGGADSEQGPYQGGEVNFLDNGFEISATGGDIWSDKLGCTYAHLSEPIKGDFTFVYTIEEHTTDPATTWSKFTAMRSIQRFGLPTSRSVTARSSRYTMCKTKLRYCASIHQS